MHVKARVAEEEPMEQAATVDYTYKQAILSYPAGAFRATAAP